jgi:hypothetical protein
LTVMAIEYIRMHSAISSMPHNMVWAIEGHLVIDREEPWFNVLHHLTEN